MEAGVAKRLINVADYYKMAEVGILKPSDHIELIHGEIYEMSPIGSKHASIVNRLANLLNRLFEGEATIGVQNPIRLDENNEPEPDISILKYRADYYMNAHPSPRDILAVIEVADSSIKYDKEIKAPLYASCEISAYWIIDIEKNEIEVLSNPVGDMYVDKSVYKKRDTSLILLGKNFPLNEILT